MGRFKKVNKLSESTKVFIVMGGYPAIKKALLDRGKFYSGRLILK